MTQRSRYALTLVVDGTTLHLLEVESREDERTLQLVIDGQRIGDVSLSIYNLPGVAVDDTSVAVWAGPRLAIARRMLPSTPVRIVDLGEDIVAVYPRSDSWIVVVETGVLLIRRSDATVLESWPHSEVLLEGWWSGGRLFVRDLRRHEFCFEPSGDVLNEVVPRS